MRLLFFAEDKVDEIGSAGQCGDAAYWEFRGSRNSAGERVSNQQEEGTEKEGVGEELAVVATKEQPRHVRHDKSDEADGATEGHHHGDQYRGGDQHDVGRFLRVDAQRLRRFLAHLQDVQVFGVVELEADAGNHNRYQPSNFEPGDVCETAHRPEVNLVHFLLVHDDQQRDEGGDEEVEGDADEQQRVGVVFALHAGDAEDDKEGEHGGDESG